MKNQYKKLALFFIAVSFLDYYKNLTIGEKNNIDRNALYNPEDFFVITILTNNY